MTRWLRVLICLLLVCCLLVRISPIQTKAVGAGILYNIAANTGVNLALRAIGVGPGNSPEVFNNLVSTIGEAVSSATAPLAQLLITGSSGNFRSFLSADFLSWVLSWLFDSGTVSSTGPQGFVTTASGPIWAGSNYGFQSASAPMRTVMCISIQSGIPNLYFYTLSSVQGAYFSPYGNASARYSCDQFSAAGYYNLRSSPLGMGTNGNSASKLLADYPNHAYISYSDTDSGRVADCPFWGGGFSTSEDLTLDSVGDSLDSASYTDWVGQSVSNDDQTFLPVSVPSLDSSTISAQTQTQAQAGTIPDAVVDDIIAGEDVVPDTGTIADVITSIRALGTDIVAAVQAIPAAIADVFTPSADIGHFSFSLSDYFPFCIPFDLYDFVTCLNADPVAPVIEWEIYLPGGSTYPLELDLSVFDPVARLLRRLELLLFCVGLAFKTRDLIKG